MFFFFKKKGGTSCHGSDYQKKMNAEGYKKKGDPTRRTESKKKRVWGGREGGHGERYLCLLVKRFLLVYYHHCFSLIGEAPRISCILVRSGSGEKNPVEYHCPYEGRGEGGREGRGVISVP